MILHSKGNSSASLLPLSPNSNFSQGFKKSFLPPFLPSFLFPTRPSFHKCDSSSSRDILHGRRLEKLAYGENSGKAREFSVSFSRKISGRWVVGEKSAKNRRKGWRCLVPRPENNSEKNDVEGAFDCLAKFLTTVLLAANEQSKKI